MVAYLQRLHLQQTVYERLPVREPLHHCVLPVDRPAPRAAGKDDAATAEEGGEETLQHGEEPEADQHRALQTGTRAMTGVNTITDIVLYGMCMATGGPDNRILIKAFSVSV